MSSQKNTTTPNKNTTTPTKNTPAKNTTMSPREIVSHHVSYMTSALLRPPDIPEKKYWRCPRPWCSTILCEAMSSAPIPIPASTPSSALTSPPPVSDAVMTSPTSGSAHRKATSPPIDPSKLNNQPAPLPAQAESDSPPQNSFGSSGGSGASAPSRSPENPLTDSAYLDQPAEQSSHPTIAETGVPASNGEPGPSQGQLKRAEKPKGSEGIIKLGSLGGDGLKMKPPVDREE
ncbi:hypothetical protein B9479_002483 [Cryptococcus floricola]|uniref:Uncharacterized protein n=1 Tax=Cryptococcus floricola TaxID=2591691 RepID=A0A5D3B1B8_9TREE|nr:hypothetical protein B9479_002483 [Cryptococcus floricola]